MQTINCKYHGPTNHKGARVSATTSEGHGRVYVSRNADRVEDDFIKAARLCAEKMDWKGTMQGGHTKDGMVFVFQHGMNRFKI